MQIINLLLFLVTFTIAQGSSASSRALTSFKLQQSPFGIGVQNALSQKSRHTIGRALRLPKKLRLCSQSDDGYVRHAAVQEEEADSLRVAIRPHLKTTEPAQDFLGDELDWLEGDATPCVQLSVARPSLATSLPTKSSVGELVRPIRDFQVPKAQSSDTRGGGVVPHRPLVFWENMVCGAVSRSIAQTIMHPANTMKTILQSSRGVDRPTLGQLMRPDQFRMLTRGAGANFLLSVPHGAVNFAVLEFVRGKLTRAARTVPFLRDRLDAIGPALDFSSSAISTICCSVVSTPQMMITDNIMAGNYPNLAAAISGLYKDGGIIGFYRGWFPGLVGKIPSYALTWTFFQQLKRARNLVSDRPATNLENTIMGCMASAASVCIMIPMDTIKTRLVTQTSAKVIMGAPYKGIIDCAVRVAQEEGIKAFYRGLPPRLISVVPMIGIQFGVYEAMKKVMLSRNLSPENEKKSIMLVDRYGPEQALEEAAMEVAASSAQPLPAPHFLEQIEQIVKTKPQGWLGFKFN